MFGHNEITGQSFFREHAPGQIGTQASGPNVRERRLLVTSKFVTLQGEGPYRGEPAYFIRLAKCNLACSFCDTYFDTGDWYGFGDLEETLIEDLDKFFGGAVPAWAHYSPRKMVLVITGGEPTLQENLGAFLRFVEPLFEKTQIESNGIIFCSDMPDSTTLVCSPKCNERDGKAIAYLRPNSRTLGRANCLKFVMCADLESPYSSIPEWAHLWREQSGRPIFISPMNIYNHEPKKARDLARLRAGEGPDIEERNAEEVVSFWEPGLLNMEANQRNHEYAANYAIRNGCIFNIQVHLLASVA